MLATFEKFDQSVIYMGSAEYEKFIREQDLKEKAMVERLGQALKT